MSTPTSLTVQTASPTTVQYAGSNTTLVLASAVVISQVQKGLLGLQGPSAYQAWLNIGNTGTEADFLADIKGAKGDPGTAPSLDANNTLTYGGDGGFYVPPPQLITNQW